MAASVNLETASESLKDTRELLSACHDKFRKMLAVT
jgi:hypothetical protein